MNLYVKKEKYSDFYFQKDLTKQVFVEEPDLTTNNVFIFKDIISNKENITFKRTPQVYAIELAKNGKWIESRICYTTPIKLFFVVENQKLSINIIENLKGIFSNKFAQLLKPVITSFGIKGLTLKKKKISEEILYFYVFNNIYFRNLKHLYNFMENIKLDKKSLEYYGKLYSVPLFNQNFCEINNLYDYKYGMLQYLEPGSDCEICYVK